MKILLPGLDQEVEVRGLKVREINALTDRQKMMSGEGLDHILASALDPPGQVEPKKLLAGDRNALLVGIRRVTWGDIYDLEVKCPACSQKAEYEIDLSKVQHKKHREDFAKAQYSDPTALHAYELPQSGVKVYWRFLDGFDDEKRVKISRTKGDQMTTEVLALKIRKAEGFEGPIKRFIEEMTAVDAQEFSEFYEECEPGLDSKVEITCKNSMCMEEMKFDMPIEPGNFFKRSATKKHS